MNCNWNWTILLLVLQIPTWWPFSCIYENFVKVSYIEFVLTGFSGGKIWRSSKGCVILLSLTVDGIYNVSLTLYMCTPSKLANIAFCFKKVTHKMVWNLKIQFVKTLQDCLKTHTESLTQYPSHRPTHYITLALVVICPITPALICQ